MNSIHSKIKELQDYSKAPRGYEYRECLICREKFLCKRKKTNPEKYYKNYKK
jgi:hypothetical protein